MDRVPLIPSGGAIKASSPGTKAELYEVNVDSFKIWVLQGDVANFHWLWAESGVTNVVY